jgi:hypothetical protein
MRSKSSRSALNFAGHGIEFVELGNVHDREPIAGLQFFHSGRRGTGINDLIKREIALAKLADNRGARLSSKDKITIYYL